VIEGNLDRLGYLLTRGSRVLVGFQGALARSRLQRASSVDDSVVMGRRFDTTPKVRADCVPHYRLQCQVD
jgi:hypothetical protein